EPFEFMARAVDRAGFEGQVVYALDCAANAWFDRETGLYTLDGKDYDRDELIWLWDVTTKADEKIIVNNWKGVNSRYYEPGPFSGMERMERRYVEWILQELARKA
ncbi:MAG: hypothetical protein ACE5KS_07185, partial [Woeseiaceae bacterium]